MIKMDTSSERPDLVASTPPTPDITEAKFHARGMEMSSENRLIEDFDSYWDEINERVSISRVLNDSVLREMIKSICEEANEKIASKEKEISILNKRLNSFKSDLGTNFVIMDTEIEKAVLRIRQDMFETSLDLSFEEKLGGFKVFMERQIETLKEEAKDKNVDAVKKALSFEFEKLSGLFGFVKSIVFEKQWEHELQKEVSSIVFRSYFETVHEEFEFKFFKQIDALKTVQRDWEEKVRDFNVLREELNSISKSLSESEFSYVPKANKDFGTGTCTGTEEDLEVYLKHLSKDETINYFKCEITKMRRQNEMVLAEKTEELFKLKRAFLNERGSSFKKDKDFEVIKAKLPEIIAKMDEIVASEVKLPVISIDQREEICRLEGKIDLLLADNKKLRDSLEKLKNEVNISEEGYLLKIEKLSSKIENLEILGDVRDGINRTVLRETFEGYICKIEDMRVQIEKLQDQCFINERNTEEEKQLVRVDKEMDKLKEIISFLMDKNEKLALGTESRLERQRNKIELVKDEIEMLRENSRNQKGYILDSKKEIEMNNNKLDKALEKLRFYEMEMEKQRELICKSTEESKGVFSSYIKKEKEEKILVNFASDSVQKISGKFIEFENILQESIDRNENRLRKLSNELNILIKQVNHFRKNEFRYQKILEIRTSNLEKAEAEVDLLGDEVDTLLNLLGKVYIALDHYSPVFKHYPGVMEILKLVKSELQGENI